MTITFNIHFYSILECVSYGSWVPKENQKKPSSQNHKTETPEDKEYKLPSDDKVSDFHMGGAQQIEDQLLNQTTI
jgi:hypothetical protein